MFSLHNSRAFLLLIFAISALTSSINSQQTYNAHVCFDQSFETINSYYKSNFTDLMDSLSSKASQNYSFYNNSSNFGIYGLFLCRGDVSNNTCRSCVRNATQEITTRCPSHKTAIIWYDQCMLRYSNVNFFGEVQTIPIVLMWNVQNREWNSTSPDEPNYEALSLMYALMGEALKKEGLFWADSETLSDGSEQRYWLVQCSGDINTSSCRVCISHLMKVADLCCKSKLGWRILAPSCNIRYENYSFFQQPVVPPPLQPPQPAVPPLTPLAQPSGN